MTTFSPGVCASSASGLSECCSRARMLPPYGNRTTRRMGYLPRVRLRMRATWQTSWLKAG